MRLAELVARRVDESQADYLVRASALTQELAMTIMDGVQHSIAVNATVQIMANAAALQRANLAVVVEERKQSAIAARRRVREEDEAERMAKAKEPKPTDHEQMLMDFWHVDLEEVRKRLAEALERTRAVGAKGTMAQQMARLKPE